MAAGKPLLGAINGETAKVIEEAKCGNTVNAEDYKSLSVIIEEFTNLQSKNLLSSNSKKYYKQNYSKEEYLIKLNKAINT